ncbi:MAG: lipopolysaccharide biosynthesis protein [Candidatus Eisenbacteria bacterium]|nr:oligosaccharide flippase family protein [Candidatus Eisenbacteria bacterium]
MSAAAGKANPAGLVSLASRNAATAIFARASALLVGILLTPFLIRKLGSDLYGVVVATSSAFEYLLLMRGGIGAAMRRHVTLHVHSGRREEARAHYAVGFWLGNAAHLAILIGAAFLAYPYCRFLGLSEAVSRGAAFGVWLVILAQTVANTSATLEVPLYATGRLGGMQILNALNPWIRLAVLVIAFSLLSPSLSVYGASLAVAEVPVLLALGLLAARAGVAGPPFPRPQTGTPQVRRDLLAYGGVALLSQISAILYTTTDNILIGRFFGPSSVTAYSLGARWEPMIRGFLWAPIVALAPLFTQLEAHEEEERSRGAVRRAVRMAAAIAVPCCLVPSILGDLFLVHWVGEEYRGSAVYLVAMLAPSALTISLAPVWAALVGRGRIGWIAIGDLVVAVANVAISLLLAFVAGLGILGFALGNTIALLLKNLLLIPLAGRREATIPGLADLLLPIPKALLGGAPALVLLWFTRPVYGGSMVSILAALAIGGLLCLAGAALVSMGPAEIRRFLRKIPRSVGDLDLFG